MLLERVKVSWVREFTIMVLSIKSSSSLLSDMQEVCNMLLVCEVLIQVILKVLEHVHVLLNEIVSSHSIE